MAGVSLYDYQIDAVRRMKNGCILCGGVGSGKSRTALAYYYILGGGELDTEEYIPMGDPPPDLYIITTARKRDTLEWEGELTPFLLSTHHEANLYCNKVVIDSWNNIAKYVDVKDAFFIFDEQRVVGKGAWVKSFLKIAKSNQWILLSATPGDSWMDYIPVFIANGFYRNRSEFLSEHVVFRSNVKFPQVDRYLNTGRLIKYRNSILVGMDFKRKTISHHELMPVSFDVEAYKNMICTRWDVWNDRPIENASEYCYALRKLVNTDESRKKAVLDIFEKYPRLIIFYNFDYELTILRTVFAEFRLTDSDFQKAEWNGHKHQPVPDSKKWVYLVQYSAGAEGWNCITTDTIVFYSQNYSYKIMEQAIGRIDRLNTPYTDLYYYHLRSHADIDTAIYRALRTKKRFNETNFYERGAKT